MTSPLEPIGPRVAVVIPIAQLAGGERTIVRRRKGRPRRVETAPTVDEEAYLAAVTAAAAAAEAHDEPLQATRNGGAGHVVDAAIRAVAVETAALAWDRRKAQAAGSDAGRVSSRRTNALMRLADLVLVREQLRRESQDLDPELLDRAAALFAAQVEDVIREVVDAPVADRFIAALRDRMTTAGPPSTWGAVKDFP